MAHGGGQDGNAGLTRGEPLTGSVTNVQEKVHPCRFSNVKWPNPSISWGPGTRLVRNCASCIVEEVDATMHDVECQATAVVEDLGRDPRRGHEDQDQFCFLLNLR